MGYNIASNRCKHIAAGYPSPPCRKGRAVRIKCFPLPLLKPYAVQCHQEPTTYSPKKQPQKRRAIVRSDKDRRGLGPVISTPVMRETMR